MEESTAHTIWFKLRKTDMLRDPPTEQWNVMLDWDQSLRLCGELRGLGAEIVQISSVSFLTLEGVAKKFQELKLVAAITAPSPFNDDGTLTEEAIKRGAKLVPNPEPQPS